MLSKRYIILVLVLLTIFLGIYLKYFYKSVSIIEKPNFNLTVDISPFIELGCVEKNYYLDCKSIGLENRYSCDVILPTKYLGGLSPKVPIVECIIRDYNYNLSENEGIRRMGCMLPSINKYVILINGDLKVINNKEEFKQFFTPIETKEEALSYVIALTGSFPMYNITIPSHYRVFVKEIEETYVKEIEGGFKVHLFDYLRCGCGPHPYYAVDYVVTRSGDVKEIYRERIFENPKEDNLCVD